MSRDNIQDQILKRIARVEGQLRGVQKLIASDADCVTVAQQMNAARKALDKSHHLMLSCMIEEQVKAQTPRSNVNFEELKDLLAKYL